MNIGNCPRMPQALGGGVLGGDSSRGVVRAVVVLRGCAMSEAISVTLISNSGPGISQTFRVTAGTPLSQFLAEHEVIPGEHAVVWVNRRTATSDYVLRDGDRIVVSPRGIRGAQRLKVKNEVWEVHLHDDDPFPSSPHAHNYEKGLKLDLRNGDLYRGSKRVDRLPKKKLLRIREERLRNFDDLQPLEI